MTSIPRFDTSLRPKYSYISETPSPTTFSSPSSQPIDSSLIEKSQDATKVIQIAQNLGLNDKRHLILMLLFEADFNLYYKNQRREGEECYERACELCIELDDAFINERIAFHPLSRREGNSSLIEKRLSEVPINRFLDRYFPLQNSAQQHLLITYFHRCVFLFEIILEQGNDRHFYFSHFKTYLNGIRGFTSELPEFEHIFNFAIILESTLYQYYPNLRDQYSNQVTSSFGSTWPGRPINHLGFPMPSVGGRNFPSGTAPTFTNSRGFEVQDLSNPLELATASCNNETPFQTLQRGNQSFFNNPTLAVDCYLDLIEKSSEHESTLKAYNNFLLVLFENRLINVINVLVNSLFNYLALHPHRLRDIDCLMFSANRITHFFYSFLDHFKNKNHSIIYHFEASIEKLKKNKSCFDTN